MILVLDQAGWHVAKALEVPEHMTLRYLPPYSPEPNPARLVQEFPEAENRGKAEPSGSQDMIGLVYPGINRLD